jgi:hypothetical protein
LTAREEKPKFDNQLQQGFSFCFNSSFALFPSSTVRRLPSAVDQIQLIEKSL